MPAYQDTVQVARLRALRFLGLSRRQDCHGSYAKHCHDLYHCVTDLNDAVGKVRKRGVRNCKLLRRTKFIWLKDKSRYTPYDWDRFKEIEEMNCQVSQAWKVKELFRDLIHLPFCGDMEAYHMMGDWMADALSYNIDEINAVSFMFKRHLKGIISIELFFVRRGLAPTPATEHIR